MSVLFNDGVLDLELATIYIPDALQITQIVHEDYAIPTKPYYESGG